MEADDGGGVAKEVCAVVVKKNCGDGLNEVGPDDLNHYGGGSSAKSCACGRNVNYRAAKPLLRFANCYLDLHIEIEWSRVQSGSKSGRTVVILSPLLRPSDHHLATISPQSDHRYI